MRQSAGFFSPSSKTERRSARLSIGRESLSSVLVVIPKAPVATAGRGRQHLPVYEVDRGVYGQWPATAMNAASAASAAVSARRILGPREIGTLFGAARIALRS